MKCTENQIYFELPHSSGCLDINEIQDGIGSALGVVIAWIFAIIIAFYVAQSIGQFIYEKFLDRN